MKIKEFLKVIKNKNSRFLFASNIGLYNYMSDEKYIQKRFNVMMPYKLDLNSPRTFNEKLQWLKLYNRKDEYTIMVDKYLAKEYVGNKIGFEHIIPTFGVWESFDEINFDELPDKFVLKCTHDSGGVIICKKKSEFDYAKAKKIINRSLKRNFYYLGREWPYKNVKPRIIAEQYMEDIENSDDLTDFKVHCFSGEPKAIQVIYDRFKDSGMKNEHYDLNWNKIPFGRGKYLTTNVDFPKPDCLNEILYYAKQLSTGIPFLRVDFYIINKKVYFGEMTFFPASGFGTFNPEEFDFLWGKWIELPKMNKNKL